MVNKIKVGILSLLFFLGILVIPAVTSAQYYTSITDSSAYQTANAAIQSASIASMVGAGNFAAIFMLGIGVLIVLAIIYVFAIKILLPFFQR
jgi:uncharacterized membrane protein